jgi:GNAT superfamily N-acetyltransferase
MLNKGLSENGILFIRNANSEELAKVSLLIRNAYLEYKNTFSPEHWKLYLENIMDLHSRLSVSELIIAELNGQIVGTVTFYLDASRSLIEGWPQGWAGVRLLGVHPAYRGQRIGHSLMEECIHRCRKRKVATIGLHTAEMMNIARNMYEGMGFVRAPVYDFYPRPDIVVIAYSLQL